MDVAKIGLKGELREQKKKGADDVANVLADFDDDDGS